MHSAVFNDNDPPGLYTYKSGVMIGIKCYESETELMGFHPFFPYYGKDGSLDAWEEIFIGLGHSHLE